MEHDTIIWNLPPLFFIYWMPCNVNCTRIIPFRENLAQSHRFKSFWLWAVTHILISCIHHERCTHSLRGKWKMHLRKRTISSFFHCSNLSHCQTSATTSHKCRNCSMNFTSSRTFSFTSEQVLPEPLSVLVSSMYVCVWLATSTTMSDASMILTLEHHNNRVVRMMSSLFVQVSSSQLQIAASVSVSVLWKLFSLSQNRCLNALVLLLHSNQIFHFIFCRRKCVGCSVYSLYTKLPRFLRMNVCQTCRHRHSRTYTTRFLWCQSIYLLRLTEIDSVASGVTKACALKDENQWRPDHRNEKKNNYFWSKMNGLWATHVWGFAAISHFVKNRIECDVIAPRWSVYSISSSTTQCALCVTVYLQFHSLNFPIGSFFFAHFTFCYCIWDTRVIFLRLANKKKSFFHSTSIPTTLHFAYRISVVECAAIASRSRSRHTHTALLRTAFEKREKVNGRNEKQFFFGILKTIICLRNGIISWRLMVRCLNSPHESMIVTTFLPLHVETHKSHKKMKYVRCALEFRTERARRKNRRSQMNGIFAVTTEEVSYSRWVYNGKPFCWQHGAVGWRCSETKFVHVILIKTKIQYIAIVPSLEQSTAPFHFGARIYLYTL